MHESVEQHKNVTSEYWPDLEGSALSNGILLSSDRFEVTAVRNRINGKIHCEIDQIQQLDQRINKIEQFINGIPIVRGTYRSIKETIMNRKDDWKVIVAIAVLVILATAIVDFTLPNLTDNNFVQSQKSNIIILGIVLLSLGLTKVVLVLYSRQHDSIIAVYLRKNKVFRNIYDVLSYHGAEHKVLNYYESSEFTQYKDICIKKVRDFPISSCACGSCLSANYVICLMIYYLGIGYYHLPVLVDLVIFPFVYGIAYEIFYLSDRWPALSIAGLWLQKHFFTVEPSSEQIEVAIKALTTILKSEDENIR